MKTIGSERPASRRKGALGVHSINRFHFAVPDLETARTFYSGFGLEVEQAEVALAIRAPGEPHLWGTIAEGSRKKHGYISFGAHEDDMTGFAEHLRIADVKRIDPPKGADQDGLWIHDHDGNVVQIVAAEKTSPNEKVALSVQSIAPGERGMATRGAAAQTFPRRLSHILLFTRSVPAAIDYYTRIFGLRLSDRSGEDIAFLHGVHGSDHHLIAFARSDAPGLHHLSWDVGSVDEIGTGAAHMAKLGFSRGWGMGRHVLGSNYFHYIRDPWGSYCEYSADIDYVPADCDWPAGDFKPEDAFYAWGPDVPEDFIRNYEA